LIVFNRRTIRLSNSGPLRADAARNRARLIEVARELFLAGEETALDSVAKAAGVGIGTLYRHFPTREALITAVYRSELDALEEQARALLAVRPAADALRQWMNEYAQFVSTKHAMAGALRVALSPDSAGVSETRQRIGKSVAGFVVAGAVDGSLRSDVDPDDVALAMAVMVLAGTAAPNPEQTRRLLDLLMSGVRS
jgi:AcrR family transcriptional regulator